MVGRRGSAYGALKVHEGAALATTSLARPLLDPEIGLHYNRYRYYDPTVARYLQPDPLGYEGSPVNLYSYCTNPVVAVDVVGLAYAGAATATQLGTRQRTSGREGLDNEATKPDIRLPPAAGIAATYRRKYADRAVDMTDYGQNLDERNQVSSFTRLTIARHSVSSPGPMASWCTHRAGRPSTHPAGRPSTSWINTGTCMLMSTRRMGHPPLQSRWRRACGGGWPHRADRGSRPSTSTQN